MRWLTRILIGIVLVLAAFAVLVALQPSAFKVTRTANVAAPPDKVFAAVNDFHRWQDWSPWAKLDPNAKAMFEGPGAGKGAMFAWSGNDKIGEGRMEIKDSHPSDNIAIKIDFVKPVAGTADTDFTFKPDGSGTAVSWTMSGEDGFIGKAMRFFMNIDKMIGDDFDKGLAQLKSVAEAK